MSDEQQRPEPPRQDQPPAAYGPPPYWYAQPDDDEIDLFALWDILWDGKWWIIAITALCTAAAITYALLADEIYEARVIVFPADQEQSGGLSALANQFGGLASLAGVDIGGEGGQTERSLERLKSFAFTKSFIEANDLMPVLFADKWDSEANNWNVDSPDDVPTIQDGVKLFSEEIRRVSTDNNSGATTITVAWRNPEWAAEWANRLVERLNDEIREKDVTEARRSIEFLNEKLDETSVVEMQQTIYRLIEAQTKTVMLANVRDEYAFTVVDPAYAPEKRSKPKRGLIAVLGVVLGGMLGLMSVFIRRGVHSYKSRYESA